MPTNYTPTIHVRKPARGADSASALDHFHALEWAKIARKRLSRMEFPNEQSAIARADAEIATVSHAGLVSAAKPQRIPRRIARRAKENYTAFLGGLTQRMR